MNNQAPIGAQITSFQTSKALYRIWRQDAASLAGKDARRYESCAFWWLIAPYCAFCGNFFNSSASHLKMTKTQNPMMRSPGILQAFLSGFRWFYGLSLPAWFLKDKAGLLIVIK